MRRAFVCGCRGVALDSDERAFLRESEPFGVILFKRNVESSAQLHALIQEIRECLGRSDAEVLVDQEGGRVQRLGPPHWRAYAAASRFAAIDQPFEHKEALVRAAMRLIARDLREVGISIDCAPVLDVRMAGAHDVIGDRAYGDDPQTVSALGRASAFGLLDEGVLPVMKHAPGHGRSTVDSHKALPVVSAPLAQLIATDFRPFAENADLPAAMTAHVVYTSIDAGAPATLSAIAIKDIVRKKIGFSGLLFSDDLSMQALSGDLGARATGAFAAGVDIALHCNGDLAEAQAVAAMSPVLAGEALARAERASLRRSAALVAAPDFDPVEAWAKIAAALAIAA